MTEQTTEQALLGQILGEVRATRGELTAMQVQVAEVVAELRQQSAVKADHETRIRSLEASDRTAAIAASEYVTHEELAAAQADRSRKFLWAVGLLVTVIIAVITPIEAALIARLIGAE